MSVQQTGRCGHERAGNVGSGSGVDGNCPDCGMALPGTADELFRTVDRFTLLERIGSGAFGEVWAAHDESGERVALKMSWRTLSEKEMTQVTREALATTELTHPRIAKVHEVGHNNGQVFIVSDLVEGVSLDVWRRNEQPTYQRSMLVCQQLAEVLHHAHEAGVVHRDLKPSNIIVDSQLQQPHLVDFGLAANEATDKLERYQAMHHSLKSARKRQNNSAVRIMGTPTYMSPEQAQGNAHSADRRSDVYSLGVIMYELLTRNLPYRGDVKQLIHAIQYRWPKRPRQHDRSIPQGAELICMKAMCKEPQGRYPTAMAMAEDCERVSKGEPISARMKRIPTARWPFFQWRAVLD